MNKNVKRILKFFYYLPSNSINYIQYFFKNVKVQKGHETKGILFIKNSGKIFMGNNVRINSSAKANPIGSGARTYLQVLKDAELIIGNKTRMSNCAITAQKRVYWRQC